MERDKKRLTIVTNYNELLEDAINTYNSIYKTDFKLLEFIHDEVNFAIVEYCNSSESQIFDLGRIFGGMSEAFDKKISNPPSSFM
jgi:hypothetical protein